LLYYFCAISTLSRPVAFETETRPETFKTETCKHGSQDESSDRHQNSRLHHWWLFIYHMQFVFTLIHWRTEGVALCHVSPSDPKNKKFVNSIRQCTLPAFSSVYQYV